MFQIYKKVNWTAWISLYLQVTFQGMRKELIKLIQTLGKILVHCEEIQNQINIINNKLDILNQDFQSRISKIEKKIELYEKNKTNKIKSESLTNSLDKTFNTKKYS